MAVCAKVLGLGPDVIQSASAMALLRYHERRLLRRFALFAAAATFQFTAKGISS
jgi:hypothetical protein